MQHQDRKTGAALPEMDPVARDLGEAAFEHRRP
jgi:hypothetical protein